MSVKRVQLKVMVGDLLVYLNPYTDCVKNIKETMPLPGSDLLGVTVIYVGPTDDTYTLGTYYTCKSTSTGSYYWEAVDGGGGEYTLTKEAVDEVIGASATGSATMFYNQQGAFASIDLTGYATKADVATKENIGVAQGLVDDHAIVTASDSVLGHIKVDNDTITVDANGVATSHAIGHNIFDIFYSMSSKTPAGAMDLSLGTLIASCNTVFPDFWNECLQRRGNAHMFPQFSGSVYYYWRGDNVIDSADLSGDGNAVCYYNGKIYVLASGLCDCQSTPPPLSSLWRLFIVPTELWDALQLYSVGDTVLYNGLIWCARPTSISGGWAGVGTAPGTTDADGYIPWALYDLPTLIIEPSIRLLTEAEWQAEVTANGSCGAFVVDETAMSVRLPKITHMIQPGGIGVFTEAGLPNIYGQANIQAPIYNVTGAFVYGGTNNRLGGTTIEGGGMFSIDASTYNAIYGNSTTVQPPAVGAKLYIQVYTSAVPASVAQAAEFINMLEAKADRTELSAYLPLAGGTMTGTIVTTETSNTITSSNNRIIMSGGSTYLKGGNLRLYGDGYDGTLACGFALVTHADETQSSVLMGNNSGTISWTGKRVEIGSGSGTVTASYEAVNLDIISGGSTSGYATLRSSTNSTDGAYIAVYGKDHSSSGQFRIYAANGTNRIVLIGTPAGGLTWNGKDITLGYPKYSSGISVGTVSSYTVAQDGWLYAWARREGKYWHLCVGSVLVFSTGGSNHDASTCFIPVKKGDVIKTYNGYSGQEEAFAVAMKLYPNR